jgi:hypothetical protein
MAMAKAEAKKYSSAPPGVNPIDLDDYPMERSSISGCLGRLGGFMVYVLAGIGLLSLVLSQRSQALPTPTLTPTPTVVMPTATPSPTLVASPIYLIAPPARPPTATAIPTAIPFIDPGHAAMDSWKATYESLYQPQAKPSESN